MNNKEHTHKNLSSNQTPEAERYAVIMAGGVGSRLWPLSRKKLPKQFLDFFGDGSMICKTVNRLEGLIKHENILIVTNKSGKAIVRKQLPDIPSKNIIVEPTGKNTAPCIALATAYIKKRHPNAIMAILPADHLINNIPRFQQTLEAAIEVADKTRSLVTIGMKPTRPETGFGYIQSMSGGAELTTSIKVRFGVNAHKVKTFAEKPDHETAKQFLSSGDFLWNSGVFIWHVDSILHEFSKSMPQLFEDIKTIESAVGTRKEKEKIEQVYSWTHSISIDYGVMEKAESVYVLEGDFDWSDAGSWDEIIKFQSVPTDETEHKLFMHNSTNTVVIKPKEKTVAVIGIDDVIIIETNDALLICRKGDSQEVKHIVDALKRKQLEEYI